MPEPTASSRPIVVAAVMATMFMVAIEATIVSTAMPQIVAQLGGLDLYSWVFSSFLLTQTAMTVVFGKLADIYGRKPIMLIGIALFLLASIGAGFAWSMPSLIVFRLLQGVGAGAMQPVAMTIIADLFPIRERGKVQGYLASVWAISAVTGPMIGGFIIRSLPWAWVFWMNIPVGVLAAGLFFVFLREAKVQERRPVDYAGAALFTVTIASLMVLLTTVGGDTRVTLPTGALFLVGLVLFVWWERRAEDPVVSFALWRRPPIAACNAAILLASMALMGLTTFLPMYMQGVLHKTPVVAGFTLTMMVVGWPAGATIAAKTFPVFGLRRIMLVGSSFIPAGAAVFPFLGPESSPVLAGAGSLVMGFGMGLLSVCCLVLIQDSAEHSERGSATASNLFSRNLGSTLGATVLGAVLNFGISRASVGAVSSDRLRAVIEGQASGLADLALENALRDALHFTFAAMLVISLAIVPIVMLVPTTRVGAREKAPAE